jgi:hypothetical protein
VTTQEINKRFAELVGLPLCDFDKHPPFADLPNFCADPRLVLKVMNNHSKGKLFYAKLMYAGNSVEIIDDDGYISRYYMTDTAGKLALKAIEFMEKEK